MDWLAGITVSKLETGDCSHPRESPAYRPPPSLRHLITVRQPTCAFPGCRRPAVRCDEDHTVPYDQGGRTCECNLAPLCRRHHRAKQAPGWHLVQDQPGQMTWRLPSGRSYATCAEPYPV
jgi:HNH endonuclease